MDMAIDKTKLLAQKLGLDADAIIPYKRRSEGPFAGSYDPEEVFEDIVRASKGSDADLTGMLEVKQRDGLGLYEQLRRLRGIQWPAPTYEIARKGGSKGTDGWTLDGIYQHFPKLKEIQERKGEVLSGGEQQMLTIARTLMGNPDLVLLDEPTEGLAPIMVMEVMKIIRELKDKGETILLVEQNSTLALSVSQRAYILENGHVVHAGPAEEIAQNAEIKQRYLGI